MLVLGLSNNNIEIYQTKIDHNNSPKLLNLLLNNIVHKMSRKSTNRVIVALFLITDELIQSSKDAFSQIIKMNEHIWDFGKCAPDCQEVAEKFAYHYNIPTASVLI